MNITPRPLTVVVTKDNEKDSASITIKNDKGDIVIGPLTHHFLSTKPVWQESINEHIAQLINKDLNIVNLETTLVGIKLPTQD